MEKRLRPKKIVISSLYVVLVAVIITGAFLITKSMKGNNDVVEDSYTYVSSIIIDNQLPVMNETKKMIKPFTNEQVTVGKTYYDYKGESKSQEGSITYYDGSYIQN